MKLSDLISALAGEIEIIVPELTQYLQDLSSHDADDEAFTKASTFYSEQVTRVGEAADMVGFQGLEEVCNHVNDNVEALAACPISEREAFITFLKKWPHLVIHYLKHLEDPSSAAGLVDCLRDAPIALDKESALKVMHKLGSFPSEMEALDDDQVRRPVVATPNDVALEVPEDVEPTLLEGFYQEAPGQTEHLVQLLSNLVSGEGDLSDLTAAKRIAHTLKGTGAIIGLNGLATLGHHFEDVLEYFENKAGQVNPQISTVLLDAGHCMAQMVAFLMGNDDYPEQAVGVLQNILDIANTIDHGGNLENFITRNQTAHAVTAQPLPVKKLKTATTPGTNALRVSMERIEELFRVSAEVSVHSAAMEAQIKKLSEFNKRLRSQQLRVKTRLFELETVVDVRSLAMMYANDLRDDDKSFDPLELEQYNELHSTTHALLEEFNDVMLLSEQLSQTLTGLNTMENHQQVLTRDLQHLVIGTRMSEVGTLEARLQRNIRTTCQMTDKQARLLLTGGDTLIDSDVLNQLSEPLLHLLRNAVDHGIESPERRIAMGKDPVGTIHLDFSAQGQQIFLRCADDGKGLDYESILQRAIEKGLVAKDAELSNDEIGRLILASGFSTRDRVSEVSGRGVGLDVVREWLNTVNGSIAITSEAGQNTVMTLNFASSLTTVQSLVVEVAEQAFALPSVQIQQALTCDEGKFVVSGESLQYHYNDRIYGAKRLSTLLSYAPSENLDKAFAVLMTIQDELWAIAVDHLLDSRELLLKPPGIYMRHIPGIVGTSILGNGGVAIHLDMTQLLVRSEGRRYQPVSDPSDAQTAVDSTKVLIVEDSLSVRNTLQELVEDAGFTVRTARDGIEAVSTLDSFAPDIVLTDLEMPNMNGVELTSHIRNRQGMEDLPVIMITSRSQKKHREMAMQAGVSTYLTKPYNDSELLEAMSSVLAVSA